MAKNAHDDRMHMARNAHSKECTWQQARDAYGVSHVTLRCVMEGRSYPTWLGRVIRQSDCINMHSDCPTVTSEWPTLRLDLLLHKELSLMAGYFTSNVCLLVRQSKSHWHSSQRTGNYQEETNGRFDNLSNTLIVCGIGKGTQFDERAFLARQQHCFIQRAWSFIFEAFNGFGEALHGRSRGWRGLDRLRASLSYLDKCSASPYDP